MSLRVQRAVAHRRRGHRARLRRCPRRRARPAGRRPAWSTARPTAWIPTCSRSRPAWPSRRPRTHEGCQPHPDRPAARRRWRRGQVRRWRVHPAGGARRSSWCSPRPTSSPASRSTTRRPSWPTSRSRPTAAEAKAASLTSYTKFASIRAKRVETVSQLAASRFDWAHALREVSRVLPENAWLTSLTATTSPSVTRRRRRAARCAPRSHVPAIEMSGLHHQPGLGRQADRAPAPDRRRPARQPGGLDQGPGAQRGTVASDAGSAAGGDCRGGHAKFPVFNVDVFFEPNGAAVPTTAGARPRPLRRRRSRAAPRPGHHRLDHHPGPSVTGVTSK